MKILAGIFITAMTENSWTSAIINQSINHSTSFHQAPATCLASEIAKGKIFKKEALFSCLFYSVLAHCMMSSIWKISNDL